MPISIDQLVALYPSAYHMAEVGSFDSIENYGLLSTTAILDVLKFREEDRTAIERHPRRESVVLDNEQGGAFTIRDQKPLSATKLASCLQDGLTVEDWCLLLNRKVFFWVSQDRVNALLKAPAYNDREHIVLEFDTRSLVEQFEDEVTLAPMNTGTTNPFAHPRGKDTITKMSDYPYEDRRERRLEIVRELCVDYQVQDVVNLTTAIWRARADEEWKAFE